jgi:DNA gyrase subunit A
MGRATQGVKLINIKDSDSIAAVAKVMHEEEEAMELQGEVEGQEGASETSGSSETPSSEN